MNYQVYQYNVPSLLAFIHSLNTIKHLVNSLFYRKTEVFIKLISDTVLKS